MSSRLSRVPPPLPRNYAAILATLHETSGTHLSAQDVFARVRCKRPAIGFATVHRGLGRLHELGYAIKLDVPGSAAAVYEPATAPHAHFRCTACGAIRDVDFTVALTEIDALAERLGLEIAAEATTFSGRCPACRAGTP